MKQQILESRVIDLTAIITQMNSIVQWQANRIPGITFDAPGIGLVHPLTCGNDSRHGLLMPLYDLDKMKVVLVCPDCDYVQESVPGIVTGGVEFSK